MNEIIEIKQLPVIVEQLQTIKVEVTERTKSALSLVCTEDTLTAVKKERAALTKEFTAWEEKRKEVKKAIISPYEQFEAVYKDCITEVFKTADNELKTKINNVENELKAQKTKQVKAYFDEYLQSVGGFDFINFDRANIQVSMSASLKSLKDKSKEFIDRICDDLALIDTQEHKDEIMYEYKQTLNVSSAITTVSARYKAIEEAKAKAEERKAIEESMQKAVEKVASAHEPITAPVEEEKTYTVIFTVKGTKTKLKALKEFLTNGGYDYE